VRFRIFQTSEEKIMTFNEQKFLENAQKIHLKPEEISIYSGIPDGEIRKRLDDFVDCGGNLRFSKALDEICENLVGRTMFKLLMAKMTLNDILKSRGKVRIMEQDNRSEGSKYCHKRFAVKINFDFYDDSGIGVPERQYYCLSARNEIERKLKSMVGSMFHEFCHCLHHISKTTKEFNTLCLEDSFLKKIWLDDEELRTVTCFDHDPICDHCFDCCRSILKGNPFRPRYAHNTGQVWHPPRNNISEIFYRSICICH
jgi:hypothetical protein